MGYRKFTEEDFARTKESVHEEGGPATGRGEQRHREGRGLDPLVDPKAFGVTRRSLNRFDKKGNNFVLTVAPAMLKETRFDTTGSMGDNVQLAFNVLPKSYRLLKEAIGAPLGRYDLQIINAIFADVGDAYVLCRSQAEMDQKIAEQLRLMVPEGKGGDSDEDPQYGLFGAAYLTSASIVRYGLKSYDFTVTDACGRAALDPKTLVRVFGDEVYDRVAENGGQIKESNLPTTKEVVQDLLEIAHAFLIQIGTEATPDYKATNKFWTDIYGRGRVISIPSVKYLPEVEAAITGLTEGVLNLQTIEQFLITQAQVSPEEARRIKVAVAGIPIGAQAVLPNFNKLPVKGNIFASKTDIWPIGSGESGEELPGRDKKTGKKRMWL